MVEEEEIEAVAVEMEGLVQGEKHLEVRSTELRIGELIILDVLIDRLK